MGNEPDRPQRQLPTRGERLEWAREYLDELVPTVRAVAFWSAICLPWVALGLVLTGRATSHPQPFVAVVLAAVLAAAVGHRHAIE